MVFNSGGNNCGARNERERKCHLEGLPYTFLRNDILRCQVLFEKASSHRNYNSDVIQMWNEQIEVNVSMAISKEVLTKV